MTMKAFEFPLVLPDLSSSYAHHGPVRSLASGCEHSKRRKRVTLDIIEHRRRKPSSSMMVGGQVASSARKRRPSRSSNSYAARTGRLARADVTSTVRRTNLIPTLNGGDDRTRAGFDGFAQDKKPSGIC